MFQKWHLFHVAIQHTYYLFILFQITTKVKIMKTIKIKEKSFLNVLNAQRSRRSLVGNVLNCY